MRTRCAGGFVFHPHRKKCGTTLAVVERKAVFTDLGLSCAGRRFPPEEECVVCYTPVGKSSCVPSRRKKRGPRFCPAPAEGLSKMQYFSVTLFLNRTI